MTQKAPIIIIKKKVSHGGHHGGAWKVAYADFVTAMMALFIVLWLLNSSKQIRVAVGGYFKDPTGTSKKVGNGQTGSGENFIVTKDNMDKIKDELEQTIHRVDIEEKLKNQISMTITAEGLRVELMENEKGAFFSSGSQDPTAGAKDLLSMLAAELGKLPNKISIEGHTDSRPFSTSATYTNWELSADRANAARRVMTQNGLQANQITQVRGYADQRLRNAEDPQDPANRRISVIVHYVNKPPADEEEKPVPAGEHGGAPKPPAHTEAAAPAHK
jgi:chemotaxis protein MotB